MAGLLPKRRTRQEIEQAENILLRKHDAYFEAWLRNAEGQDKKRKQSELAKASVVKPAKTNR